MNELEGLGLAPIKTASPGGIILGRPSVPYGSRLKGAKK